MKRAQRLCLVVCFLVCPLLFFTNLTRNPYVTQISLLNVGLILACLAPCVEAGLGGGPWRLPRTPLDLPLWSWLGVCALSWGVAYWGHRPFFRPAMASEGSRAFLFLIVNALAPFYLSAACASEGAAPGTAKDGEVELGLWAAFAVVWGLLWTGFPQLRGPGAAASDVWGHVWDGYGAVLWTAGAAAAYGLCRRGRWVDYLHLALAAGFFSSAYGICQYFNLEFIWPAALNPYGGRSVSTFGNPNFMSSFDVVLLPFAIVLYLQARGWRRTVYAAVILSLEAALLCSMTRSSWGGAAAAAAVLALSPEVRRLALEDPRPHGLLAGLAALMALFWPASTITAGYTPSVISRLTELGQLAKSSGARTYGPFHQRLLIWTCAWQMGAENPLTGKGWGLFEMFYPFYQGTILNAFDFFSGLRTHANNSHNEILETWAQTGLLGVGVLCWIWTTFARGARRWFSETAAGPSLLLAAAAAGVAGMLADNLLNVSLHFAVPAFLFWWTAGAAMGARTDQSRELRPGPGLSKLLLCACAALAAGLSWYWVCAWNREVHYFAGFKLLRQGGAPAAISELERSRSWGPPEVNAIYELGNAYARAERFPDADRAYRQALSANTGYDEIYYNIGAVRSTRLGDPKSALDYFRMARLINPLSKEVYGSLGNLLLQDPSRYRDEAAALFERATHFFPDDPSQWNNLGYLYALQGRVDDAEKAYVRALEIDPGMATAARNLELLSQKFRRPRARILDGAADLRKLDEAVAKKDYSDATLALAKSLAARYPDMPKARFLYGSLLLVKGRAADAASELERVVARDPRHAWAFANLGSAYLGLGRSADAVRAFRAALAIDPQNPAARERLKALGIPQ